MDAIFYQLLAALLTGIIIGILTILLITGRTRKKTTGENVSQTVETQNWNAIPLIDEIRKLPEQVLHTIQGSISPKKGKVGELIFYTRLLSEYDRLISLGQPVDFIGVKNRRYIDIIEVKTGKSKLSKEEAEIKRLVEDGNVRFILHRADNDVYHQRKLDGI